MAANSWRAYESVDAESLAARAGIHAQKKSLIAIEQDAEARAVWRATMATCDPRTLVFLDETNTPTTLTPLRARSRRGTRAIGTVPRGRWTTVTLLATLTPTGFGQAVQFPGPVDRLVFDTFVETILVPSLRPGQTVVLDNLSVHKSAAARQLIETAGCQMVFLPTYSPDFNPIEQACAKLMLLLRKAAADSYDAILAATSAVYFLITDADTIGFYRSSGYNL